MRPPTDERRMRFSKRTFLIVMGSKTPAILLPPLFGNAVGGRTRELRSRPRAATSFAIPHRCVERLRSQATVALASRGRLRDGNPCGDDAQTPACGQASRGNSGSGERTAWG